MLYFVNAIVQQLHSYYSQNQFTNIADIPDGSPYSVEGLKVHICEQGNGYLVTERKFIPEVKEGAVVKKQVHVE